MKYSMVRTAVAVPRTTVGNLNKNTDTIIDMIKELDEKGVNIAAFPELCITSYTMGDLFRQSNVLRTAEDCLMRILKETESLPIIAIVGLPVIFHDKLFNVAAVLQSGQILGMVPKAYIPNYSEYYEERWFTSGEDIKNSMLHFKGQEVPFGVDLLFQCDAYRGLTFGVEVCEDLWAPFPPHGYQALAGSFYLL